MQLPVLHDGRVDLGLVRRPLEAVVPDERALLDALHGRAARRQLTPHAPWAVPHGR
jgi:hypothetical protein